MDITDALAPTSDQLDAIELVNPRTFTIDSGSSLGKREGKTVAEIRLVGFDRVWRPSKGMLDVLAGCWGTDAKQWVGRRVTLFNDPEVMFGPNKVGGIRISHLSHIDRKRTVTIRASGAGRKQQWPVEPLPDVAPVHQPITPEHERAIGEQMKRAGLTGKEVLDTARAVAGRDLTTSRDLTAAEADGLIATLADLPTSEPDDAA